MGINEAIKKLENHIAICRQIGRDLELKSRGLYQETHNSDVYEAIETIIDHIHQLRRMDMPATKGEICQ